MKKLELWQTTDGQIFDSEETAKSHQNQLDFAEWYEKSVHNQLPGNECAPVMNYILRNQPQILKLINTGKDNEPTN